MVGLPPRQLKADAKLPCDIPDDIRKRGLVAGDLAGSQITVDRVVDSDSPVRVQARMNVVVDFAPGSARANRRERGRVDALQYASIEKAERLAGERLAHDAPAVVDSPAKVRTQAECVGNNVRPQWNRRAELPTDNIHAHFEGPFLRQAHLRQLAKPIGQSPLDVRPAVILSEPQGRLACNDL